MLLARRIADFVDRQYVSEKGDVRDNIERLFSEDLRYHTGGETLGREDLVVMGHAVRSADKECRRFSLSGWDERGSTVRWHLSAYLPGMGPNGSDVRQESELRAQFGTDGLVELHDAGEHTTAELGELFGVARSTVYRTVKRAQVSTGTLARPLRTRSPWHWGW